MAQKISDLNVAPDLVNLPINRLVWIDMEVKNTMDYLNKFDLPLIILR